jgi:hypothetical protein
MFGKVTGTGGITVVRSIGVAFGMFAGPGKFIWVVVASAGRYASVDSASLLNGQIPVVLNAAFIVEGLKDFSRAREYTVMRLYLLTENPCAKQFWTSLFHAYERGPKTPTSQG